LCTQLQAQQMSCFHAVKQLKISMHHAQSPCAALMSKVVTSKQAQARQVVTRACKGGSRCLPKLQVDFAFVLVTQLLTLCKTCILSQACIPVHSNIMMSQQLVFVAFYITHVPKRFGICCCLRHAVLQLRAATGGSSLLCHQSLLHAYKLQA